MIVRTIRHHVDGRLFEWGSALAMLGIGAQLLIWPKAIAISEFHTLGAAPPWLLAFFYLAFSIVRGWALALNGRSYVYGPRMRSYGALGACIIWSWMLTALIYNGNEMPSPGIPVYFALACCELYTSYRAASDVRKSV
jgi:hypothetical protein